MSAGLLAIPPLHPPRQQQFDGQDDRGKGCPEGGGHAGGGTRGEQDLARGRVGGGGAKSPFWSQLQSMPDLAARNARIHARYRTQAAALVREGVASGELRADADPEVVAALMVAITSGIATQAYAEPGAFDVEAAIDQAGEAIVRLVTAG